MDYLKDQQYYEDLYDLLTIKECLEIEQRVSGKKLEIKGRKDIVVNIVGDLRVYFIKGERYRHRSDQIREWVMRDQSKQEFVDKSKEPSRIYCNECGGSMMSTTKDLDETNDKMRVLFFFECTICHKRKGVFDNGEIRTHKPDLCPKCRTEMITKYLKENGVLTTTLTCPSCEHKQVDVWDMKKEDKEWEARQIADRKLLIDYREKYCLNEKEGSEFIQMVNQLHTLDEHLKLQKTRETDPNYQKALKLKKLTAVELEKLITKPLIEDKYLYLSFDKPEIEKFVIIPFTVQDTDPERKEYDSKNQLSKLLKKTLEDTNWRLMSEGVTYRLGYVYGRLKGYEREEDLIQIVS